MTWYGDIYHNGDWFSRAGAKMPSPEQNFTETAIRRALAAIYGGGSSVVLGTVEPTPADLSPYLGVSSVGGYTKYTNIPWGPCFGVEAWAEPTVGNAILQPVVTIYIPPGPAPVGGFPVVLRTHANGSTHVIEEGTGSLWTELVVKAMNEKRAVASLEFRHPVPNVALGAPHLDVGYGVQFVRALSTALSLNPSIVDCYATSRGNLALWQAVSTDLADAGNANFAKRQSSGIRAIWGVNTQDSFSTTEFISQKIVAADQAACLADPAYADDPRWGSAQQLILRGTQELPYLCSVYDADFLFPLPSEVVGRYTKAQIDANGNLRVHCPEFGKALLAAYKSRGKSKRIVVCDGVTGGVDTTGDAISWFKILDEHPGISAKAARAQAQQRRIGGTLHYLEGASPAGAYISQANPTAVTLDGDAFGVLVDGAWGSANRLNTATPLGATMVQSTTTLRPKLATIAASGNRAFSFDADDNFRVALTNTTVDVRTYPVGEAPVLGASSRGAAVFTVSSYKIASKTVSLVAAVPNTTFSAQEAKFLDQLALELEGAPGTVGLVNASLNKLLPPFPANYTRSGPDLWCPQADGSLASFAADVIPREWANGRWGYRFDPGWSQRLLWTHDLSNAVWTKNLCSVAASKVVPNTTSGDHFINNNSTVAAVAGDVVTVTAHVKPDGYNWVRLSAGNTAGGVNFTFFDLVNGVVGTNSGNTASITKLADGSCIVSVTRVASASGAIGATVHVVPADNTFSWAGDGVKGVQVFSANLTNTTYPVPITVAQGTAGTVGNFSAGWDASALPFALSGGFSFGGSVTVLNRIPSQYPSVINFRPDGVSGSSETVEVFIPPTGNQLFALVRTGSVDTYGQNYVSTQAVNRFAVRAAANSFRSAFNGQLQVEDLAGAMPATNYIQIGRNGTANLGAMYIHDLWVTKSLLTGNELTAIS